MVASDIVPLRRSCFVALAVPPMLALLRASASAQQAPTQQTPAPAHGAPAPTPAATAAATTTTATTAPAPAAGANTSVQDGQVHLAAALRAFRDHDYAAAIREFELANAASPSADLWYNIARSHELLSEYDRAIENYRRYLRDKVDPPDRAQVERHITELQRLADQQRAAARRQAVGASLRFEGAPTGAAVFLGDRLVGRAPLREALAVQPGVQQVRVTAPGMQEFRSNVRVRRGQTLTAFVSMEHETRYRTRAGGHVLSYILGAAGIVGLGVGAGLGISALGMAPCGENDNHTMTVLPCGRYDREIQGDVVLGAGALVLLGAAITYFIEAGSSHTEVVRDSAPTSDPR